MRVTDNKNGKFWSKLSFKKLFSRKYKREDFHADGIDDSENEFGFQDRWGLYDFERRHSCSGVDFGRRSSSAPGQQPRHSSAMLTPNESEILKCKFTDKQQFRIFVGTWNVGGRTPNDNLEIDEWLGLKEPADIYVIGFQEVVPLNAGNVLGAENNVPAARWLHLIRHTLNNTSCHSLRRSCSTPSSLWTDTADLPDNFDCLRSANKGEDPFMLNGYDKVDKYCEEPVLKASVERMWGSKAGKHLERNKRTSAVQDEESRDPTPNLSAFLSSRSLALRSSQNRSRYALIASKQMVGIFLSVWVRGELQRHVRNRRVSCVGCGLMGYLGNKGSISISMSLHQTTFCFVCSHLTSGQKDGDEIRRNSDVLEILKRTQFRRSNDLTGISLPETILEHDRVIWLGDLNYRIALSPSVTRSLLAIEDWDALLKKDQLHIQRKAGRVFSGWHEGRIYFAPTYKYRTNSDCYALEKLKLGDKRRTPAWCDRILWYGSGLKQLAYVRAEERLSDHRPVYAVFSAEVEALSHQKLKDLFVLRSAKVEVEELLPFYENTRCYTDLPSTIQNIETSKKSFCSAF